MKVVNVLLLLILVLVATAVTVPPAGLYITLREDSILSVGNKMGLEIADSANQMKFPDVSGSASDGITYTLSNFKVLMELEDFSYSASPPIFTTTWNKYNFVMQFNYHVCKHLVAEVEGIDEEGELLTVCENGFIDIYTIGGHTSSLSIAANVDISGETIKLTGDSAKLSFSEGAITVNVQCTSTICAIPVHDIANAAAKDFVPTFEKGTLEGFNNVATKYFNSISTTVPTGYFDMAVQMRGDFVPVGSNLVFYSDGLVIDEKSSDLPPYKPTSAPPLSVFTSPPGEISFTYNSLPLMSGLWSLNKAGVFNKVITQKDIPKGSPVTLSTNSFGFILIAPGITSYPNMDITVTTSVYKPFVASLDPAGVSLKGVLQMVFSLQNSTYSHKGWTLNVGLGFAASLVANNDPVNHIHVNGTFSNFTASVTTASSSVGTINDSELGDLIPIVAQYMASPANFVFPTIPHFAVSETTSISKTGYGVFASNFVFDTPPGTQCGPSLRCPVETTCCAHWPQPGCCQVPHASCCQGGGCCPPGTRCIGNGECQR